LTESQEEGSAFIPTMSTPVTSQRPPRQRNKYCVACASSYPEEDFVKVGGECARCRGEHQQGDEDASEVISGSTDGDISPEGAGDDDDDDDDDESEETSGSTGESEHPTRARRIDSGPITTFCDCQLERDAPDVPTPHRTGSGPCSGLTSIPAMPKT
jgi:hypothetical protein